MSDSQVTLHFFRRLCELPAVKAATGAVLWVARLLFGAVVRPAYTAVMVLWLLDWATGTARAWADPGDVVRSRRWYHSLIKLTIYLGLLILGYQVSTVSLLFLGAAVQSMVEGAIIATEALSVTENLDRLGQLAGVEIPIIGRVAAYLRGRVSPGVAEMERKTKDGGGEIE